MYFTAARVCEIKMMMVDVRYFYTLYLLYHSGGVESSFSGQSYFEITIRTEMKIQIHLSEKNSWGVQGPGLEFEVTTT
jgi:hypothetical protein